MEKISGRITADRKGKETAITISGRVEDYKMTLLVTWLVGFGFCGAAVLYYLLFMPLAEKEKIILIIFMAFWLYFFRKVLYVYRWRKWGQELILISEGQMMIKMDIKGKGKEDVFELERIKNLRPYSDKSEFLNEMSRAFWSMSGETIAFDCEGRTYLLGIQLTPEEAKSLLKSLRKAGVPAE